MPGNECYVAPVPATTLMQSQLNASQNQGQGQGQGQSQTAQGGLGGAGGVATAAGGAASAQGGSVGAVSAQGGHQTQGQGQNQRAQGGDSATSVDSHAVSTTTVEAARIPVATALAGFQNTTAPCRYAEGLGIQTTGAGAAVGFTFEDSDCKLVLIADGFYTRGQWLAGDRIMCKTKALTKALGKDCLDVLNVHGNIDDGRTYHPAPAPTGDDAPVTHREMLDIERRMLQRGVGK